MPLTLDEILEILNRIKETRGGNLPCKFDPQKGVEQTPIYRVRIGADGCAILFLP